MTEREGEDVINVEEEGLVNRHGKPPRVIGDLTVVYEGNGGTKYSLK